MQSPLDIRYHHVPRSEALESRIREKAADLERFFDRIVGCHVLVERPGHHHREGAGAHYRIRVELTVPGEILVVGRDPAKTKTHEDPFLAVNEAFQAMRRQLQDYVRRRRGFVKSSASSPHGRVLRLFRQQGYGFLETPDGREIYFNRASVLDGAFERLEPGFEVRFAEEAGDEGPQASTVQLVGEEGHHVF